MGKKYLCSAQIPGHGLDILFVNGTTKARRVSMKRILGSAATHNTGILFVIACSPL